MASRPCSPPGREFSSGTTSKPSASRGQKSPLRDISVWPRGSVLAVNTVGFPGSPWLLGAVEAHSGVTGPPHPPARTAVAARVSSGGFPRSTHCSPQSQFSCTPLSASAGRLWLSERARLSLDQTFLKQRESNNAFRFSPHSRTPWGFMGFLTPTSTAGAMSRRRQIPSSGHRTGVSLGQLRGSGQAVGSSMVPGAPGPDTLHGISHTQESFWRCDWSQDCWLFWELTSCLSRQVVSKQSGCNNTLEERIGAGGDLCHFVQERRTDLAFLP